MFLDSEPVLATVTPETQPLSNTLLEEGAACILTDAERAMALGRQAYELSEGEADQVTMARSLLLMARAFRQNGDIMSSREMLTRAHSLLTELNDTTYLPQCLQLLGNVSSAAGDLVQAVSYFEQGLPLARAQKQLRVMKLILNSWGIVYIRTGNYARSLECYAECLELLEQDPDPYMECSILTNIGGVYQRLNELEIAKDYLLRALALGTELNDIRSNVSTLLCLSDTCMQRGEVIDAQQYLQQALKFARTGEYADLESVAMTALAELALQNGDPQMGIDYLSDVLAVVEATGNRMLKHRAESLLGNCYQTIEKFTEAEHAFLSSLQSAKAVDSPQQLFEAHRQLAEYYEAHDRAKEALPHLRLALEFREKLVSESNQRSIRDLEMKIQLQAQEREMAVARERAQTLEETNRVLQELTARQIEILRAVSHDMRNPLGAIIGMANQLRTDDTLSGEEQVHIAEIIEQSGDKLLLLVEQLLYAAELESGGVQLELETSTVHRLMERVLYLARPVAATKGVHLSCTEHGAQLPIEVDEEKVSHVLNNLISNAIKFTPTGGEVFISAEVEPKVSGELALHVSVRDTGIGIPAELLDKIFDKFGEARRMGTGKERGTGLGMAIVKQLVDLMRGTITVRSIEGAGTTIDLRMDVA